MTDLLVLIMLVWMFVAINLLSMARIIKSCRPLAAIVASVLVLWLMLTMLPDAQPDRFIWATSVIVLIDVSLTWYAVHFARRYNIPSLLVAVLGMEKK